MQKNLIEYLETSAKKFPHKKAIVDENGSITFQELRHASVQLAMAITKQTRTAHNAPIFVYLPKSHKSIIAFLGILYSGHFYTPSDVEFPFTKVALQLQVLKPILFISDSKYTQKLIENGINPNLILNIDTLASNTTSDTLPKEIQSTINKAIDQDIAYTLFTSGSTGIPKGVAISHRSVINYIDWLIDEFHITDKEKIGNQAPFYFDNSTFDIYLSLATGATLHIIKKSLFAFPVKLIEYINHNQINLIFWVPSVLSSVANMDILSRIPCTTLQKIMFAGEVMPNKILNYWRKNIPNAMYVNLYGPTESTVDCTFYVVDRDFSDDESLPIGKPCRNYDILVLNESNERITTADMLGELCVRGTSLALGYYGDFEKSKEAFTQNPLNTMYEEKIYRTGDLVRYNKYGELLYCGRKDSQIKHLGYRIELGEIESAAFSLESVCNAAAIYDWQNKKIVLFVSMDTQCKWLESGNLDSQLIKALAQKLAQYMLPSMVINLEAFPLNDNGKINRKELATMYENMITPNTTGGGGVNTLFIAKSYPQVCHLTYCHCA